MKKIKVLLPSIALAVVLMFSITIGVYAATSVSFSVTSTISFSSPDISAIIKCYVGDVSDANLKHTWDNVTTNGKTEDWTLPADIFNSVDANGDYNPVTINFVIANHTGMPVYTYFAKTTKDNSGNITASDKVTTATIDGNLKDGDTVVNPGLLTIAFDDEKTLTETVGNSVTLSMTLTMKNVAKADTVTISGYDVYLSKFSTK